ncbi:hypothetical protein T492DRAFT_901485 [Pavlovales sp. CCMP2436]|nr:hypothetical protein T492DRAFT_901485 [Pavlovales sp. CCMP2436]
MCAREWLAGSYSPAFAAAFFAHAGDEPEEKKVPAYGPAPAVRHMVVMPVDVNPYVAWARAAAWKAVSSHCRADARSHATVDTPVLSVQNFAAMMKELLELLAWGRWLAEEDPRISFVEAAGASTWRVSLTDLEELPRIFDFSRAKADSSVATARASKKQNYNELLEVEFVHRRKHAATTWDRREWLQVNFWMGSINKLGRVTLPVNRYTAAEIKGEAARMLAACGVQNAMSKNADGSYDKPSFQGGEVKTLLTSTAFYHYVAYVVQMTTSEPPPPLPPPPPAPRGGAPRAPAARQLVVAGARVTGLYANLAEESISEEKEEEELSSESHAEAAARWARDLDAATGAKAQILLVLRAFDLLSRYFDNITDVDYDDAVVEVREAHAATAAQLTRDFLAARLRAARANVPMCSTYDGIAVHTDAKKFARRAGCRIRRFTSYVRNGRLVQFRRTWALQVAEALAVREELARLLAAGAPVKRERVCFESIHEAAEAEAE